MACQTKRSFSSIFHHLLYKKKNLFRLITWNFLHAVAMIVLSFRLISLKYPLNFFQQFWPTILANFKIEASVQGSGVLLAVRLLCLLFKRLLNVSTCRDPTGNEDTGTQGHRGIRTSVAMCCSTSPCNHGGFYGLQ